MGLKMSFSIEKNYSALNNYNYEGKSFLFSSLDWLSTPCRRVLGGRNACVLSLTYGDKMSTARKVATVFLSVLFFPIAIISIASLTLKLATFPWFWEEKKVKVQSQETWNAIEQFNLAYQNNENDRAFQIVKERPEIGKRSDVTSTLFKVIKRKINNNSSWEKVQTALQLLSSNDAINLINHAVKNKLLDEFKNNSNLTSASQIINFIQNSLKNSRIQTLETCYKELFSDALQIDVSEDILFSAFKMDLADQMIRSLTQMKISNAKNELERVKAQAEETLLRHSIFKKEQTYASHYLIFSSAESMQKISAAIQSIFDINQMREQFLNKFNAQSKFNSQQEQWNAICIELKYIKFSLNCLTTSDEEEKNYIQAVQMLFNHMIEFIDLLKKNNLSPNELETLIKKITTDFMEQTETFQSLFSDIKISYPQPNLDDFLSTLDLKKKANLFTFTEIIKSFLLNNMAYTLQDITK